jgi:hypothetical protein
MLRTEISALGRPGARGNATRRSRGRGGLQGGRIDWGAWATHAAPRRSRPTGGGCFHGRLSLATPLDPRIAFPRAPPYDNGQPTASHCTPPYVDFYIGERLAMGSTAIGSAPSRVSTYGVVATGLPIASTPVARRSPVS